MSTDAAWQLWGERDAYFSVLTDPKFRAAVLTPQAKEEFFASGRHHVAYVLDICRRLIDPSFAPQSVLEFGCGVGRVLVAFAQTVPRAVGVDVAQSMLAEARRSCELHQLENVTLLPSDDGLSQVPGEFDLVHSCITLQHIEVARGRRLFERLVQCIRPGGIGAVHVTFAWNVHAETYGQPPSESAPEPEVLGTIGQVKSQLRRVLEPLGMVRPAVASEPLPTPDPEMQMNFYNLSELMFLLHRWGVRQIHTDVTDHGGALGAFLFFRRSA